MDNFSALRELKYSGRGISVGMTPDGDPFVGYTLTGRSPSSQARRLVQEGDIIRTEVTDPEQLAKGNPALLIYPAMAFVNGKIVASNGAQTKLLMDRAIFNRDELAVVVECFKSPSVESGINLATYEPDAPNYTSRINGCVVSQRVSPGDYHRGILHTVMRAEQGDPNAFKRVGDADQYLWDGSLTPGLARFITTYKGGNENPLLPSREFKVLEVKSSDARSLCESFYDAIGPKDENNYRVAAAVMVLKEGGLESAILNRADLGQ